MTTSGIIEEWNKVLLKLEEILSKHSFETWIKPLKPLFFQDHTLILEVPNHFSREWLVERYAAMIRLYLQETSGREIEIDFIPSDEVPTATFNRSKRAAGITFENTYFNPKYTFETFVVGSSNRFAHAACLAVAEAPAKTYNPLFIYGGVGLGKTHLMQAIGHYILGRTGQFKVAYVTSEKFTNEMINSIRDDRTAEFRQKYRSIDALLIDDIQFLAGKERTQEEFFHTFNTLYEANKQVVVSSDRPPKDIPTLEDRLRSRFEWGLIADIQPPDLETRIAILRKKAQLEQLHIPDEVIYYIANKIVSNIRELEGALIRVVAHSTLTSLEISLDTCAKVLKDIFPQHKPRQITISLIQEVVSNRYNIKVEELKTKKRHREVSLPRQIAMFLAREITDLSLPKIGEAFGGRDHTTVIHACDKISQAVKDDPVFAGVVQEIIDELNRD